MFLNEKTTAHMVEIVNISDLVDVYQDEVAMVPGLTNVAGNTTLPASIGRKAHPWVGESPLRFY